MSLFTVALDDELRTHLANAVRVYSAARRRDGLYGLPPVLAEFQRDVLSDSAIEGQEVTDSAGLVVGDDDAIYVGVDVAARLLNVSRRTVARRVSDGSLPSLLLGGRRLIRREDLKGLKGKG